MRIPSSPAAAASTAITTYATADTTCEWHTYTIVGLTDDYDDSIPSSTKRAITYSLECWLDAHDDQQTQTLAWLHVDTLWRYGDEHDMNACLAKVATDDWAGTPLWTLCKSHVVGQFYPVPNAPIMRLISELQLMLAERA